VLHDHVLQGFPGVIPDQALRKANNEIFDTRYGPDLVFVDRVGAYYYLGIASGHWGWGQLMRAAAADLFPFCKPGLMDVSALPSTATRPMIRMAQTMSISTACDSSRSPSPAGWTPCS
jgi:hypothetical protein